MKWLKSIILSEADKEEVEEPATMEETETPEDSGEEDTSSEETVDQPATMEDEDAGDEVTAENSEEESMDEGNEDTVDDGDEVTAENSGEGDVDEPAMNEDGEGEETTDDSEGDGDEVTAEGSEDEESMDDEGDDSSNNETLKKVKLIDEYKELYDVTESMKVSLNNIEGKVDQRKTEILDHAERLVDNLLEDISFVMVNKFTELDYKTLLTHFYRFKYQLNYIIRIIEFLVQEETK